MDGLIRWFQLRMNNAGWIKEAKSRREKQTAKANGKRSQSARFAANEETLEMNSSRKPLDIPRVIAKQAPLAKTPAPLRRVRHNL